MARPLMGLTIAVPDAGVALNRLNEVSGVEVGLTEDNRISVVTNTSFTQRELFVLANNLMGLAKHLQCYGVDDYRSGLQ